MQEQRMPTGLVEVRVTHRFAAPAQAVYHAWLDPVVAGRWLFATPQGRMTKVEIDARIGGGFTIVEDRAGEEAVHLGEYLELNPPRRIVFSFYFPAEQDSADKSVVTVDILPLTIGGCMLTLVHERVSPEWADRTRSGWTSLLEQLDAVLGRNE